MATLFVADDDIIYQRIIKMTLNKYPVFKHVNYFNDGRSLLLYLIDNKNDSSNLPDVIFLDIHMPELDGWGVLDAMQNLYSTFSKKIEIYIVSVSMLDRDKQRALRYDFVKEFISKPISRDTIVAIGGKVKVHI
jgi:CheY-like chemotaxis protein